MYFINNGDMVGCLTPASSNGDVTIRFEDGQRTVSPNTLRRLLPRTVVAQLIARSTPNVSAWMVRKADEQGAIEPDVKGRFAGHAVHYYDEARIPLLIEQLSGQDSWTIGTMVIHDEYGPGRVVAWQSRRSGPTQDGMRLVQFFGHSSPVGSRNSATAAIARQQCGGEPSRAQPENVRQASEAQRRVPGSCDFRQPFARVL